MAAYYNEIDPNAAEWLRQLIKMGQIAPGDVDERSIEDVTPNELSAYTQCHFFAGVGGWSLALRLAGIPDDFPVWTGSAPCQPFSAAGKGKGIADERHLWPAMFWLIQQCRPETVFGEQVASKDGLGWWDVVSADLEGTGYACGAVDLCAPGVGAFHIRQRLYWVANANSSGRQWQGQAQPAGRIGEAVFTGREQVIPLADSQCTERGAIVASNVFDGHHAGRHQTASGPGACSQDVSLAQPQHDGHDRPEADAPQQSSNGAADGLPVGSDRRLCGPSELDDPNCGDGWKESRIFCGERLEEPSEANHTPGICPMGHPSSTGLPIALSDRGAPPEASREAQRQTIERADSRIVRPWDNPEWLYCRDGKARPTQPGIFPLVNGLSPDLVCSGDNGLPNQEARGSFCEQKILQNRAKQIQTENTAEGRVMRLKGYGNAIVPQLAAEFIAAYFDCDQTPAA